MLAVVRRLRDARPRWLVAAFAVLFVVGTVRFFAATRLGGGPEVRIGADGRYYWAQLTSLALDQDLDFANQYENKESGNYYRYTQTPTGRYANPFSIGPAIMWMPFFALAHAGANVFGVEDASRGNTWVHQRFTLFSSLLFAFLATVLLFLFARRFFDAGPAFAGAIVAMLCGPILQYAINQPSYAHAASSLCVVVVLTLWAGGRSGRNLKGWLWLGAAIGLAMLVRTSNVVFALPALAEGVVLVWRAARRDLGSAWRVALLPVAGAGVAALGFAPQMIAWKILYGKFLLVPQGTHYMQWGASLWSETLFSTRNGLFPYAPLWAVGLLGLLSLARRDRQLALWLVVTFMLTAYINGAASDWAGGGAVGGRRYDGLALHVALGSAAIASTFIAAVKRRPRVFAWGALASVVLVFGTCNYIMTDDFRRLRVGHHNNKDSLAYYQKVGVRPARALWQSVGNPMSWPGAWAFALRTGASVTAYDKVVGQYFLSEFDVESYRGTSARARDELRFADPEHRVFLVHGFGRLHKIEIDDAVVRHERPVVSQRVRVLVPVNRSTSLRMRLRGRSMIDAELEVSMNGSLVKRFRVHRNQPLDQTWEIEHRLVDRGVNVLDLKFSNGAKTGHFAVFEVLSVSKSKIHF